MAWPPVDAGRALDLGSGGGLPGLPLALLFAGSRWVLLDGSVTRCTFLEEAVLELSLSARVEVRAQRAEEAARTDLRGCFDVVVARSFGPPAATAECAAGFLQVGGHLVVAEPPGSTGDRWPVDGLARLGMRPLRTVTAPSSFQVIEQTVPCPPDYPRRTGIPAKRPLFRASHRP